MKKIISIYKEKYAIHRTRPFSFIYGNIGSRGIKIIRVRDNYSMDNFKNLKEFREDRKIAKAYMRKH